MLQTLVCIAFIFSFSQIALSKESAFDLEEAKTRCTAHYSDTPDVHMDDFKWGYSLTTMEDQFEETYSSGKRLEYHANYEETEKAFFLYLDNERYQPVKITQGFIKSVTQQIELAIAKGFADFVFFPDMGHAHLHFPEEHWQNEFANFGDTFKNRDKLYEKMLADPQMKALYHLAEQLKMQDEDKNVLLDDTIFFKYWHRNFVGYNDASSGYQIEVAPKENLYNTVGHIDDHKSWSAGFAVSASKDGCFPYIDKYGDTRYFDISLKDPPYSPSMVFSDDTY